ncbi:MAG: hypothetical protein ACRD3N_10565 [Terracidiphilus sp.]
MDKTIRRVTDFAEQDLETYRYWQSRPVGERLVAVCELSEAAYAFAADFKGAPAHDDQGLQGPASRAERERG